MRQYEPIWIRIKSKNTASLVTHINNEARIIKAVIKEKDRDTGHKLILADKALAAKLKITKEYSTENSSVTIHFTLHTSIKESYIGINTL